MAESPRLSRLKRLVEWIESLDLFDVIEETKPIDIIREKREAIRERKEEIRETLEDIASRIKAPVLSVILAEELSTRIAESIRGLEEILRTKTIRARLPIHRSRFSNISGVIKGYTEILNVKKPGRLRELFVKVDHSDFSVRLVLDEEIFIDDSFEKLMEKSPYIIYIDAFEEDGSYVLKISDLDYSKSLLLALIPKKPLKILTGHLLYNEIVEK